MPPWEHRPKRIAAVALDALYSFVVCGPEIVRNGAYDFVIGGVRHDATRSTDHTSIGIA
jgi:hypothetical protein